MILLGKAIKYQLITFLCQELITLITFCSPHKTKIKLTQLLF